MPLTATQVTTFFQDVKQMGLSARTRIHLQGEGILIPDDLVDFTSKDSWDQFVENCKCPAMIPDPVNVGQFIAQEAFQLPKKLLMRLNVSAKAVEYYPKTDRPSFSTGRTESIHGNFGGDGGHLQPLSIWLV